MGRCEGTFSDGLNNETEIAGNCDVVLRVDGVSKLRRIVGDFRISMDLFEEMQNLETVGGSFTLRGGNLKSFQGLGKLQSIGRPRSRG